MASTSRALTRLAVPQTGAVLLQQQAAPRLLLQTSRRTIGARPVFGSTQGPVSRQFRRGVSSEAAPVPTPPKKSRFRVLRWAWRLGYLSAIAGIGYIGYGVYQDRHPEDQIQPDPSKKTLVILGEFAVAAPPRVSRIR